MTEHKLGKAIVRHPEGYSVWCETCETDVVGATPEEALAQAEAHARPEMGPSARDLLDLPPAGQYGPTADYGS